MDAACDKSLDEEAVNMIKKRKLWVTYEDEKFNEKLKKVVSNFFVGLFRSRLDWSTTSLEDEALVEENEGANKNRMEMIFSKENQRNSWEKYYSSEFWYFFFFDI